MTATTGGRTLTAMTEGRHRRWPWLVGGLVVLAGVAVLAFGVFGVQALWIDDEVDEEAFVFTSGESIPEGGPAATTAPPDAPPAEEGPEVVHVATGTFVDEGHPGEGTANLYTDGTQAVIRFEDDFATDNGPDLKVVVHVAGEQVEVAPLKGNIGAQNYELPAGVDPEAVESVGVWCKRFDYIFTTAVLD